MSYCANDLRKMAMAASTKQQEQSRERANREFAECMQKCVRAAQEGKLELLYNASVLQTQQDVVCFEKLLADAGFGFNIKMLDGVYWDVNVRWTD